MKLSREEALEFLEDGSGVVKDTIVGHARWSILHKLIIKYKDKFYVTNYSVGATENQDESPWEYEKEVKFKEVVPKEKLTVVYVPLEEV